MSLKTYHPPWKKNHILLHIFFQFSSAQRYFQKIRQFFIRRYFKFAVSLLRKITEPFKRLYGLEETCEVYLSQERSRVKRGDEGKGCDGFRREIRNCRHIENHNSCEWRQASGIPGAYRDRYLDRVTINTDPWKVALGIIRGPRGEVTYTYLYSPPFPPPPSLIFRLLSGEAIQRK